MDQDSVKVFLKLSVVWHGNLVKNEVTFVYATKDPLALALDGLRCPTAFTVKIETGPMVLLCRPHTRQLSFIR